MKRRLFLIVLAGLIAIGAVGFWMFKIASKPEASAVSSPSKTSSNNPQETQENIPKVETYQVPILMYHYIRTVNREEDELGYNLSVPPSVFQKQVEWLKENNYATLKLADLADPDKKTLSKIYFEKKKPVVLTFDDGYEDAYTQALPILQENNMIGTFFIIRNYVGKAEYMTQAQIDKMQSAGMEIGSHSLSHPNLASIDASASQKQIVDSKETSQTFCYPAGKFNDAVVSLVKEAGYLAAITTQAGIANQDSNLFELPRVRIENISIESFAKKVEG